MRPRCHHILRTNYVQMQMVSAKPRPSAENDSPTRNASETLLTFFDTDIRWESRFRINASIFEVNIIGGTYRRDKPCGWQGI